MGKYCRICKLEYGIVNDVSYHQLPKDKETRDKWIAVIGKEVSQTCSHVCCQHFQEKDFYYKIKGDHVRRYLFPNSVPSKEIITNKRDPMPQDESNKKKKKIVPIPNMINAYVIKEVDEDEDDEISEDEVSVKSEADDNELEAEIVKVECPDDIDEEPTVYYTIDELDAMEKNKNSTKKTDEPEVPRKKRRSNTRSVGDLTREDFTSDTSWEIVKNYVLDTRKQEKLLNKTVKTLNDKANHVQAILDEVKRRQKAKIETQTR